MHELNIILLVNVSIKIVNTLFMLNHFKTRDQIQVHLLDPLEDFLLQFIFLSLEVLLFSSNLSSTLCLKYGSPSAIFKVRSPGFFTIPEFPFCILYQSSHHMQIHAVLYRMIIFFHRNIHQ